MKAPRLTYTKTKWRNRPAFCLNNGVVQLTTLTGGGHIANFCLVDSTGTGVNALWEAPWVPMDPDKFRSSHIRKYGPTPVGKFLATFTRHAVCLDYFEEPSEAGTPLGPALRPDAATSRRKF